MQSTDLINFRACLRYGEDYADEGFAILKRLASTGYPEALFFLGDAFADDGEHAMAYKHYLMAAKRGYAPACHAIGKCAEVGRGCKKSNRLSLEMYTKAATLGNIESMHRMGLAELNGDLGLRPDVFKAAKWFKRAAAGILFLTSTIKRSPRAIIRTFENIRRRSSTIYCPRLRICTWSFNRGCRFWISPCHLQTWLFIRARVIRTRPKPC